PQQARRALRRPDPPQRRSLSFPRFGDDLELEPLPLPDPRAALQRQEAVRFDSEVDEGALQPRMHRDHPPDAPRAQPVLRRVVVPLYKKVFEPAAPKDDSPGLAGRFVEKDLDPAHAARQPAPASRLTVSYSGRPTMAG